MWGLERHDYVPADEILDGIDCEHDKELLSNPLAGSTSMINLGGFATQDRRSLNKVHLIASENH